MLASCVIVSFRGKFGDIGGSRCKVLLVHLLTDPVVLKKCCDILSLNADDLGMVLKRHLERTELSLKVQLLSPSLKTYEFCAVCSYTTLQRDFKFINFL